jgi:hypothetical protein
MNIDDTGGFAADFDDGFANTGSGSDIWYKYSPEFIKKVKSLSERNKCREQTTKKYTSRPGPPFPANECSVGMKMLGNDGLYYVNRQNTKGVNQWKKVR